MVIQMALPKTKPTTAPNDLVPYWVPFTPNRAFKNEPRLIVNGDFKVTATDMQAVEVAASLATLALARVPLEVLADSTLTPIG